MSVAAEVAHPPKSLAISSNLDALLEHEDRVRRIRHAHSASLASPSSTASFGVGVGVGLPPPPRRPRPGFVSPTASSSPAPMSPRHSPDTTTMTLLEDEESIESLETNPYINPAPHFDDEPNTPISPPPRRSSLGQGKLEPMRGRRDSRSNVTPTSPVATATQDRSPSSSTTTSSKPDSRPSPSLRPKHSLPSTSSLALRSKRPAPLEHRRTTSSGRTPNKLVKSPRTSESPSSSPKSIGSTRHPPTMSRSVSDRESFIDFDLSSPAADDHEGFGIPGPSSSPAPPAKPPIPTTPKPDFSSRRRHASPNTLPRSTHSSHPNSPPPTLPIRALPPDTMPPTTNFLNPAERAQLIRKSRKLTQVFGQTPGAGDLAAEDLLDVSPAGTTRSRHRPAASLNLVGQMPASARPRQPVPWPAPDKTIYLDINGRRHSTPPQNRDDGAASSAAVSLSDLVAPSSPQSFIDFGSNGSSSDSLDDPQHDSDGAETEREMTELGPDDSVSVISATEGGALRTLRHKPSLAPSFADSINLTPEAQAEDDRRKRRDKLAKLHRFLGSRVPANLVLGPGFVDALQPAVVGPDGTLSPVELGGGAGTDTIKSWVTKRRRSSSAAVLAGSWTSDWDRMKENLNDKEKAIIVRRAQKMEKVFGVAPPQDLYHSGPNAPTPPPIAVGGGGTLSSRKSSAHTPPPSPPVASPPGHRNMNQSSYRRSKSTRRPRTGDSGEYLLADVEPSAGSFVYNHYQHSLNSLHDIIDRNDRESLAELQQYLNDETTNELSTPPPSPPAAGSGISSSPSKSERRRSLPLGLLPRASISSLSSVATMQSDATTLAPSPDPAATEFQMRRKRAAKLTQFFGVDYRELIDDVLESIEAGLDAERKRGTLGPDEAEVLLQRLRSLKTRR
ncbi:hypothetical protein HMN09_00895200 [Mycena chlorophos]|uniref:Uncharacterized protein n=1 Tax=Mycena chlorophos TaxID=658473 RepID=A0A8H6SQL4_MYCCL|nr:hypothetical protein HMN09_00895200 [Mycena chlorophos]